MLSNKLLYRIFVSLVLLHCTDSLNPETFTNFISEFSDKNNLKCILLAIEKESVLGNISWNLLTHLAIRRLSVDSKTPVSALSIRSKKGENAFGDGYLYFKNKSFSESAIYVAPLWKEAHGFILGDIMNQLLPETRRWLLITTSNFSLKANDLPLYLNNKVVFATWGEGSIKLSDAYMSDLTKTLIISEIGMYESSSSKEVATSNDNVASHKKDVTSNKVNLLMLQPLDPWGRRNLTGQHIRCLYLLMSPFVTVLIDKIGTKNIGGSYIDLLLILQEKLNFTYSYKIHNDTDYGTYHPKEKRLTGAIVSLTNNTEDIAVGNFDVTYTRWQFVKYLIPVSWTRQHLIFHKIDSTADGLSNYTREFQPSVWYLVFISLSVCAMVLWLITAANPGETVVDKSDLNLFVAETFCNNSGGTSIDFRSNSGRILSFTLFVMTMLFYIHYTCFLVSCLTVSKGKIPFTNLQELYANKNTYSLLLIVNSSTQRSLKETNSEIGQKIWKEMQHHLSGKVKAPEALRILKTEKVATIWGNDDFISMGWQNELSDLPLQEFIPTSWPIRADAVYVDILNYHFFRCLETGNYRRLEEKWKKILKMTKVRDVISSQQLSLRNVMFPFTMMGIGLVASFLILIVEIISKRHGIRAAVDSYTLTPQLSLKPFSSNMIRRRST